MPIALRCACGRSLRAKEELAGRKVRCPACGKILVVPPLARAKEEEEIPDVLPADPAPRPARRRLTETEEDEAFEARRRPPAFPVESEERERLPPRPPGARRRRRRRPAEREGWFGNINAGLLGGVAMMVIAVVWFVLGLMGGFIFFYPPILFVIGIAALIKGIIDR
jgi:DNA-directed RNA polymerase subunit RPC12/RpoP